MITDEVMDAIEMMIEICSNEEQAKGMESVKEMLGDFVQDGWLSMVNPAECYEWLEQYLACDRK